MVIDKIRKMSIRGVKLKSESFFSISPGVLELWRKNLGGGADSALPVQIGLNCAIFVSMQYRKIDIYSSQKMVN